MPDDPNAALIERMADAYNPDWSARLEGETEEAHAAYLADVRRNMSRVLDVVREHVGQELAEAERRIADLAATPDLRAAAILFRCPEGFEALAAALGIADDTEARGKLDAAFKAVARNAKEQPDA